MNIRIKQAGAVIATAIALVSASGVAITSAQQTPATPPATQSATQPSQSNPNQLNPRNPAGRVNLGVVLVCSTTNYDDVAAQALGIQSPALRQALVGGQTLAQVATSKNVSIQTVNTALKTAYEADLAQAVSNGLITQQAADQIKAVLDATPAASNATPNATDSAAPSTYATPNATQSALPNNQNPQNGGLRGPGYRGPGNMAARLLQVPRLNTVSTFIVASKAIGVSCADLIKAAQAGQSIAQVATGKNVTTQTVIDALVTAEKAAIAQNVQEGLIGQAQADAEIARLTTRVTNLVNNVGGQRGPGGFGFGGFGAPGFPGNPNGNGQPPVPPTGNGGQPPAQATSAAVAQ